MLKAVPRTGVWRSLQPNIRFFSDGAPAKDIGKSVEPDTFEPIRKSNYRQPPNIQQLTAGLPDDISVCPGGNSRSLLSSKDFFAYHFKKQFLVTKFRGSDPRIARLSHHIINKNTASAWATFHELAEYDPQILRFLSRAEISQFLSIFEISAVHAVSCLTQLNQLAQSIKDAGHELRAEDYAILISCAYKAHKYDQVEKYWVELETLGITKNTDLWNAFLMASTNAFPKFWPIWKFNRDTPKNRNLPVLSELNSTVPYARIDATSVLKLMYDEQVPANARTYELAMLYYAQVGELTNVRAILREIWKLQPHTDKGTSISSDSRPLSGDVLYPKISTMRALMAAFAFNDETSEGIYYATMMQRSYNINVNNPSGLEHFSEMLSWIFHTTEPNNGRTPKATFDKMWSHITTKYQIEPSLEMYHWRRKRQQALGSYGSMAADIPKILSLNTSHRSKKLDLAAMNLSKAARAFALEGKIKKAQKLLAKYEHVSPEFADVKQKVQDFMDTNLVVLQYLKEQKAVTSVSDNAVNSPEPHHDKDLHQHTEAEVEQDTKISAV